MGTPHPPKPHDAEIEKKSVDWSSLHHGPDHHPDQMSMGKDRSDAFDHAGDEKGDRADPSIRTGGHNPEEHQNSVESRKLKRHWP